MNEAQTQEMLAAALEEQSQIDSVEKWLEREEINGEEFSRFVTYMVESAVDYRREHGMADFNIGTAFSAGFGVGWTAHKVKLATPVEAGPPADLSDSLE